MFRLYLIADREHAPAVRAALSGLPRSAAAIQLRDKNCGARELFGVARELATICRQFAAPLLVNDRADVALATGADGVHLPSSGLPASEARALLGPAALIGASCHSPAELRRAAGADFAVYGAIWPTPGKGPGIGAAALAAAARDSTMPVFAIGGIDNATVTEAIRAGAQGVACIRAVLGAADPRAAAAALWSALEAAL